MKKDVNSINMAPVSIRWACLRIAGIAMLPTADAPVKNLAALIQLQKKRGNVKITQPVNRKHKSKASKPAFNKSECESLAHDNK
ncbi:hypothetical protein C4D60_Mb06t08090 [Musa balbisiana]|uniref:Uncharacterized protein n=1 Tax=Musa balbisiana TaxID=52838 RepID=A0A4S8IM69_MUSBA|nr:hypothetical protein C4D60_Mb06t08090 [Musa balbisiana]